MEKSQISGISLIVGKSWGGGKRGYDSFSIQACYPVTNLTLYYKFGLTYN